MPNPVSDCFTHDLETASAQALMQTGERIHHLRVAGQGIRLRFAGPSLESAILPGLGHLIVPDIESPDLTVTLWDSASTGISLPPLPWNPPAGEAWKVETDEIFCYYSPQRMSLTWFLRQEKRAFFWVPNLENALAEESFSPLMYLWSWWFARQSVQLTHAAAIGGKKGAALLVGPSGAGKSTTSLLTLSADRLRYLADDYCLVRADPTPTVYSLFATAKVLLPDRPRHPLLAPAHRRENTEKALYVVYPHFADNFAFEMPLSAIIAPKITGQAHTSLEKVSAINILRVLAPSTLLQLVAGTDPAHALRLLTSVARQVDCYKLNLGTDFERIPTVLADLLDG
jgi:hypothetical protein